MISEATDGLVYARNGPLQQVQLLFAQCHDAHPPTGHNWSSSDVEMGSSSGTRLEILPSELQEIWDWVKNHYLENM